MLAKALALLVALVSVSPSPVNLLEVESYGLVMPANLEKMLSDLGMLDYKGFLFVCLLACFCF